MPGMIAALIIVALGEMASLECQVATVERGYSLSEATGLATTLRERVQEGQTNDGALLARCLLYIAELNRVEYEHTPVESRQIRQALGKAIDDAADEALVRLDHMPASSEVWRMRADCYGVKIRSSYQARRYHKDLENAIAQARTSDPKNAHAYISEAKRYLFADEAHGRDLSKGLQLLDAALALDASIEEGQLLRAFALRASGQSIAAAEAYRSVLAANPACAPAKYELEHLAPLQAAE